MALGQKFYTVISSEEAPEKSAFLGGPRIANTSSSESGVLLPNRDCALQRGHPSIF